MKNEILRMQFMKTAHRFRKLNHAMAFNEVSKQEFFALEAVYGCGCKAEQDNGIYVSELSKQLKISMSSASRLLKGLEEKNLIKRQIDSEDRRNTWIFLTEEGKKKREESVKLFDEFMDRVIARTGEKEISELLILWNHMIDIMSEEINLMNNKNDLS
ncbi:MAG: MarR family transcriptional regulator [Lachnospiraceae bacterium]|nr:MarR family transcriptional regulator [Lachnospiraceae bacterium]